MQKQLEFKKVRGWGGKRRGAGRPNKSGLVSHGKRAPVDLKKPLHINMHLKQKMPNLRTREFLRQFKAAGFAARKFGLYLNHFSLLDNHIHLIVEANDNSALERGMKSLSGRLGKILRQKIGGKGSVWAGRFHLHVLKSPTEVKRALEYVLLNRAKHGKLIEHLDDFSSAHAFKEWKQLIGRRLTWILTDQMKLPIEISEISAPQSWLLRVGWTRAPS